VKDLMMTKEVYLTADHQCLRNSILNLVRMVPTSEEDVQQLDEILCEAIKKAENGNDV
jgi:hypothetical protein